MGLPNEPADAGERSRRNGVLVVLAGLAGAALVVSWHTLRPVAAQSAADSAPAVTRGTTPAEAEISARGRLEPKDGVVEVAGPSQPAIFINVVAELKVKEGDRVEAGQVIAVFDSYHSKLATVARLRAEVADAEREYRRADRLCQANVISVAERDARRTRLDVATAGLQEAQADLELSLVHAPISGQVLKIHTYPGERVGLQGIAELGKTDEMYAVAEVYESDITKVRVGQRAVVTNAALPAVLHGTVEHVGWKIGKMDILDSDPAAKTDARVVEVKIRLDESRKVERLTNMQVEVRIRADAPAAG